MYTEQPTIGTTVLTNKVVILFLHKDLHSFGVGQSGEKSNYYKILRWDVIDKAQVSPFVLSTS